MDLSRVDAEIRPAVARIGSPPLDRRSVQLAMRLVSALRPAPRVPGTVVGRVNTSDLRARVLRPDAPAQAPTGAVLWFHGGGFVTGDVRQDAPLLGRAALAIGGPVYSVHYPLAPHAKVERMREVAYRAWLWLVDNAAREGVDPRRIVVGGESAGAQLAAVLVQLIHDRGGPQPAGAWLFAPATDDRIGASHPEEARRRGSHFVIDRRSYLALVPRFSGRQAGADDMPDYVYANRRVELSGLPPTWIYSGDIELFHEEVQVYARRLREAGVPTEEVTVAGAVHGFELLVPDSRLAGRLRDQAIRWLRELIA